MATEKKLKTDEDPAVTRFRTYLRIKTVQPNPDYRTAIEFLRDQAIDIGLDCQCMVGDLNIVVMTWNGTDHTLPSIMLNSHIDVVPVSPENWSCDPFEAFKSDNGDIIARGSQDMKCVGMQYLEAIRLLKATGYSPHRSIHVTFVPDEEIGGILGMDAFMKTDQFKALNVGFALDEGLANPTDVFSVFYAERTPLWFKVTCFGNPGHGSRFVENTSAERLVKVINKLMSFREGQKNKLDNDSSLKLGDVTSINMTKLDGGTQTNVIPNELSATFDMRVAPTDNIDTIIATINEWLKEATGETDNYKIEWLFKGSQSPPTSLDESTNFWWRAFKETCLSLNMKIETDVFSAATDGRYLRKVGLPVIGFSPMNHTPILLHDHNEFLNEKIFLRGIVIYQKLIPALSEVISS